MNNSLLIFGIVALGAVLILSEGRILNAFQGGAALPDPQQNRLSDSGQQLEFMNMTKGERIQEQVIRAGDIPGM